MKPFMVVATAALLILCPTAFAKSTPAKEKSEQKEASQPSGGKSYIIKSGDNLGKIAKANHTSSTALAKLNNIKDPTKLQIGQKLLLPSVAEASPARVKAAKPVSEEKPATTEKPAPEPHAAAPSKEVKIHKVEANETFYSIAKKHKVSMESIVAANPKLKPTALRTGMEVRIPQPTSVAKPGEVAAKKPQTPLAKPEASEKPAVPVEAKAVAATPKPVPTTPSSSKPAADTETQSTPDKPVASTAGSEKKPSVRSVTVDEEMTYREFANKHGMDINRLNELNGLKIPGSQPLAKGSVLYIAEQ